MFARNCLFRLFAGTVSAAHILALANLAAGQAPQATATPEGTPAVEIERVTKQEVNSRLKQLEGLQDVPDETQATGRELYQQALQALDATTALDAKITQHDQEIASSDTVQQQQKAERDRLPEKPSALSRSLKDTPITALEQKLSAARQAFTDRETAYRQAEVEPNRRTTRLAEIPKLVQAAEQQLAQVEKELGTTLPGELPQLTLARRTKNLAVRQQLTLTIASLKKEKIFFESTDELVQIQRDVATKKRTIAKAELDQWQELVNKRREEATAAQAQAEATKQGAGDKQLAQENEELAKELAALAGRITTKTTELDSIRNEQNKLETEFGRTKEQVEAIGLSNQSGILLREERGSLPDMREHRREMAKRQPELGEARRKVYKFNNQRSDLATLEPLVDELAAKYDEQAPDDFKQTIRTQLKTKRDYLDALINDYREYLTTVLELDAEEQRLIDITRQYRHFIEERVFWIRSTEPLFWDANTRPPWQRDQRAGFAALRWFGSFESWSNIGAELRSDLRDNFFWWIVFLAGFVPLLFLQRLLRRQITVRGENAQRRGFSHFSPTLQVVFLTLLIAVIWPALIWFIAWRLGGSLFASEFPRAVSIALAVTAAVYFLFELLRQVCRPLGLADVHFQWPQPALRIVRRHLRLLMLLGLPLLFVTVATEVETEDPAWSTSLGRIAFIGFLLLAAVSLQRILQPSRGAFQQLFAYRPSGWLFRLRYISYPLIMASPLTLAVLSIFGYYDTAKMLSAYLFQTAWLIVALTLAYGLLNRWVLMSRRRMALDQARQRWTAKEQAAQASHAPASIAQSPETEDEVDLATVSDQTRHLIRAGLLLVGFVGAWLIWDDVVPALAILKSIELWPGASEISLADVAVAIITLLATYVGTQNVPGLLELSVLKHLPLDPGARYAVKTLFRYVIAVLGIAFAGQVVGITWSSIQWLIAAMGIGLGFGLQEIFANFISGIILLFERPIRVGDIITLGDTTGVVTRIHMRATTVTDWDRKEYIVPNKDLITGRLLNWTLTNQTNRIVVTIGVAYGSDTTKARDLLLQAAQDHPLILEDPAPVSTFEGFGDSTLNLVLRCYLPDLSQRLSTVTELHTTIDTAFKEAGIEIAFPQRDLHIRSVGQAFNVVTENGNGTTSGIGDAHQALGSGR